MNLVSLLFSFRRFEKRLARVKAKVDFQNLPLALLKQCLKITEKVSFSIASEASYVYILSGQKFIKNALNGPFSRD